VDVALQLRPDVSQAPPLEVAAHLAFRGRYGRRNQPLFHGDPMKQLIVADDRVVEIDSDQHILCSLHSQSGRPGSRAAPLRLSSGDRSNRALRTRWAIASGVRPK